MNSVLDKLSFTNPHDAVTAAYQQVSATQTMAPNLQVAGAAVLFINLCEGLGLNPSEVINKAQRLTTDADTFYTTTIRALREYIKQEIHSK